MFRVEEIVVAVGRSWRDALALFVSFSGVAGGGSCGGGGLSDDHTPDEDVTDG